MAILRAVKNSWCVAVLLVLWPALAGAQGRRCEINRGIGGALGLLILDTPVDPVPAGGGQFGLATTTGTGLDGSVHATLPFGGWAFVAEAGSGRMGVVLTRDAAGNYVHEKTGDDVAFRRLVAGLVKANARDRSCLFAGVKLGLYRFVYDGMALNAGGGAATMGSEWRVSETGVVFFELELSVAITAARAPLSPAGIVPQIRPALGFRYRF